MWLGEAKGSPPAKVELHQTWAVLSNLGCKRDTHHPAPPASAWFTRSVIACAIIYAVVLPGSISAKVQTIRNTPTSSRACQETLSELDVAVAVGWKPVANERRAVYTTVGEVSLPSISG